MSEIVFILGAGTSAEAGAPLMNDFIKTAKQLREDDKVGTFREDFDLVFKTIGEMQPLHSKTQQSLDDIETVFALFEMGQLIGGLLGKSKEDIRKLMTSIRNVILVTLEQTLMFRRENSRTFPMPYHEGFAWLIHALHVERRRKCSIITFNYDLAIDFALHNLLVPFDYCLSDEIDPRYIPLIKLHGSLNWALCSKCGKAVPWHLKDFFRGRQARESKSKTIVLNVGSLLPKSGLRHCGEEIDHTPVIVPPTLNKTGYTAPVGQVWRRAARELSDAKYIFVSGYSLNPLDSFFRYLFALGSCSTTQVESFQVFDTDPRGEIRRRFEGLIGADLKSKFHFSASPFSLAIPQIGLALRLPDEAMEKLKTAMNEQLKMQSDLSSFLTPSGDV